VKNGTADYTDFLTMKFMKPMKEIIIKNNFVFFMLFMV